MSCVLLTGYERGNARFVPGEGTRKSIRPNVLGASCELLQGGEWRVIVALLQQLREQ